MKPFAPVFVIFVALSSCRAASADERPMVHPLFSDHMVLQREKHVPIWGWTKPGQTVTVSINQTRVTSTADASGKWLAQIRPLQAGGPYKLTVEGLETVAFTDVLVGDVWICSGQSNMQWTVANSNNADAEIAAADHPQIRLFSVPRRIAMKPQQTVEATWNICTPETIPGFSAVAYYFGRELHRRLEVPIGLVHTSWGGTLAEAWTSGEALEQMDDFKQPVAVQRELAQQDADGFSQISERLAAWWRDNGFPEGGGAWRQLGYDQSPWQIIPLPKRWEQADVGLDDFDGVVLFRREFDLPEAWSGKDAVLSLGRIDDVDTTWLNGQLIGQRMRWDVPRKYPVAGAQLMPGKNVVAVRVLDTGGSGGIYPSDQPIRLSLADDSGATLELDGEWRFRASKPLRDLTPMPSIVRGNQHIVTVLNNGMLAPLTPFGIEGAIWYQGESNAGRPHQYRTLLPTMIEDWRAQFGQGEFPFFIVQLANFRSVQEQPVEQNSWAEIREAQAITAENDAKVGLVVTTDVGEANDIHPRNKQEVGRRLALSALAIAHGQDIVSSGPMLKRADVEGRTLRITFDNLGGGLVAGEGALKGFAIAGAEGPFVWADATIDGDAVVLSAESVADPRRARYNWANNPIGNLFNQAGLPAAPFRTDRE